MMSWIPQDSKEELAGRRRRRRSRNLMALALAAMLGAPAAHAATIVVNSAADTAIPMDGLCTLREAIGAANANLAPPGSDCGPGDPAPTQDVIEFAIPGAGVHTLQPTTNLPAVTDALFIDGYSQPGASPNTLPLGSNAVLLIELDGSLVPFNPPQSVGLFLAAADCEVRGLAVGGFFNGILSGTGVPDSIAAGNYVGTDASGLVAVPNNRGIWFRGTGGLIGGSDRGDRNIAAGNAGMGILISGSGHTVVGNYSGVDATGLAALANGIGVWVEAANSTVGIAGSGNVISGNSNEGILLTSGQNTSILGNLIGVDADGAAPLGNGVGIWASSIPAISSANTEIGNPMAGNRIAYNAEDGIRIGPECGSCGVPQAGHRISGNSIHDNGELGVDILGVDGVDVAAGSDPLDGDVGPNGLQNRPALLSAADDGTNIDVDWSLGSQPSSAYRIEFFFNTACDPSGSGEGEIFLDTVDVMTDAGGDFVGAVSLPSQMALGEISATATDLGTGDTSEFSDCIPIQGPPGPLVVSTKDRLFDPMIHDMDGNGVLSPGDNLLYLIEIANLGSGRALAVTFDDSPDPNTALVVGTVTTTQGGVSVGNMGGDTSVLVDIGDILPSTSVTINFLIAVDDPFPPGVTEIANQGFASGLNFPTVPTDDPDTPVAGDPTVDPIFVPAVRLEAIPALSGWAVVALALLLVAAAMRRLRSSV